MPENAEGLFWKTARATVSEQQYETFGSPEQTGRRVVEAVTGWLARALEQLPPDKRAHFRVDLERPEWIDIETPEHALHELQRLAFRMPAAVPRQWQLECDQRHAVEMLVGTRKVIHATKGIEPAPALLLIEQALTLGIAAARAHVEPWEAAAVTGKKWRDGGDKGRERRQTAAEKRRARWQQMANDMLKDNPHKHLTDLADDIAKRLKRESSDDYRSPGTIRNAITKPPG